MSYFQFMFSLLSVALPVFLFVVALQGVVYWYLDRKQDKIKERK